jgi:hypothetical protein
MLGIYLFQRYLNKIDDYNFITIWETKIMIHTRRYFTFLFINYIVGVTIISQILLLGDTTVFLSIIVVLFVGLIYGVYLVRSILKFVAINSQRLVNIKSGVSTETFKKDNVVN